MKDFASFAVQKLSDTSFVKRINAAPPFMIPIEARMPVGQSEHISSMGLTISRIGVSTPIYSLGVIVKLNDHDGVQTPESVIMLAASDSIEGLRAQLNDVEFRKRCTEEVIKNMERLLTTTVNTREQELEVQTF